MPVPSSRTRVILENVQPEIDAGRFPIKRILGEEVTVEADAFAEGHDEIAVVLLHRRDGETTWTRVPMQPLGNDRWTARFLVTEPGFHRYTAQGWVDHFRSWRRDLEKRLKAGQDVRVDLLIGSDWLKRVARRAAHAEAEKLREAALFVAG